MYRKWEMKVGQFVPDGAVKCDGWSYEKKAVVS